MERRGLGVVAVALSLVAVAASTNAWAWPEAYYQTNGTPHRRVIVFSPSVPKEQRVRLCERTYKVVRTLDLVNAVVVEERPSLRMMSAEEGVDSNRSDVLRVEEDRRFNWLQAMEKGFFGLPFPDVRVEPLRPSAPTIPQYSVQPGPEVPWGVQRVSAPRAWNVTKGRGVKVCVVDTGVDRTHPNLAGNVLASFNATDPEHPDAAADENGHGTHIAGIIAAAGKNGGLVGVAPEASILAAKVLDKNGDASFSEIVAGMQWCADRGAHVVNLSIGGEGDPLLKEGIEALLNAGIVVVAAAGNYHAQHNPDRKVLFPAAYEGVIAVSASDRRDKEGWFSAKGDAIDFIAPGVEIKSTVPGGGYRTMDGTSQASPHVAGLAALLIAAGGPSGPSSVRAFLHASSMLPDLSPDAQGNGMISADLLVAPRVASAR
ncbi:MAG: S8 family peptidase [Elusimicrobia bacterium]|nr:S8 family peptidase [Elusimicrobiota bacterium]